MKIEKALLYYQSTNTMNNETPNKRVKFADKDYENNIIPLFLSASCKKNPSQEFLTYMNNENLLLNFPEIEKLTKIYSVQYEIKINFAAIKTYKIRIMTNDEFLKSTEEPFPDLALIKSYNFDNANCDSLLKGKCNFLRPPQQIKVGDLPFQSKISKEDINRLSNRDLINFLEDTLDKISKNIYLHKDCLFHVIRNSPIRCKELLDKMEPNSAQLVSLGGIVLNHIDLFIKDEHGNIINPLVYFSLETTPLYFDYLECYNNDIARLIQYDTAYQPFAHIERQKQIREPILGKEGLDSYASSEKVADYFDKIRPTEYFAVQADYVSCVAFCLKYAKEILTSKSKINHFLFETVDLEEKIRRHYIPSAKVLKYSQSEKYNKIIYDFIVTKEDRFAVELNESTYQRKTLLRHLKDRIEYAKQNNEQINSELILAQYELFRYEFIDEYKVVAETRKRPFIFSNQTIDTNKAIVTDYGKNAAINKFGRLKRKSKPAS